MGFPSNLEELQAEGYEFIRPEMYPDLDTCPVCGDAVENFTTPGKRVISMNPMYHLLAPAVRHVLTCNTRANTGDAPTAVDAPKPSPETQQGQGAAGIDSIPMFGVTDPNYQLLSVGWRNGFMVCQFAKAKWSYGPGVPESELEKLRRARYAYRIFLANIKGNYSETKLS
jgi:hypothetical protein